MGKADLTGLETFVTVARSGSFAEAARRLAISATMVGRRVQGLEERLGAKLIERTTRSLRLTALGEQFLLKAAEVLEAVEELNELARPAAAQPSGRLRVTGPTTLGIKRLAAIVSQVVDRHPALSVELSLSDRSVDLVGEGFDLAVRVGELRAASLIARRVGTYCFACCASPECLERDGVPRTPHDLAAARCVLNLNLVPRDRWPFLDAMGVPFTVAVRGSVEIDNGEALRAAALAGAGIIYAPLDLVEDDLRAGTLVQVLGGWRLLELPIHTVHPSRRLVPRRIGVLIEAIAEGLRDGRNAGPPGGHAVFGARLPR